MVELSETALEEKVSSTLKLLWLSEQPKSPDGEVLELRLSGPCSITEYYRTAQNRVSEDPAGNSDLAAERDLASPGSPTEGKASSKSLPRKTGAPPKKASTVDAPPCRIIGERSKGGQTVQYKIILSVRSNRPKWVSAHDVNEAAVETWKLRGEKHATTNPVDTGSTETYVVDRIDGMDRNTKTCRVIYADQDYETDKGVVDESKMPWEPVASLRDAAPRAFRECLEDFGIPELHPDRDHDHAPEVRGKRRFEDFYKLTDSKKVRLQEGMERRDVEEAKRLMAKAKRPPPAEVVPEKRRREQDPSK
jgi:hypothetical protein